MTHEIFVRHVMNDSLVNYVQNVSSQSSIKSCLILYMAALEICSFI